mmetsp:Transcript_8216/g.13802  ORF Transcript_8216/g.13802 Transcript_8216/m.13802 type:complete len:222 (+) Transcript_8216:22-687(+)
MLPLLHAALVFIPIRSGGLYRCKFGSLEAPRSVLRLVESIASAVAPAPPDLSDESLLQIVLQGISDEATNELVWKYLGYERDSDGKWNSSRVFPNWRKKYPQPPDVIGITRTYTRQVDEPVLRAVQALQRSVPREHKDRLKATLRPLGWKGFKLEGLTPNMTRRAQVATWLLYYRTALHGVPIEELQRRKAVQAEEEAAHDDSSIGSKLSKATGTTQQSVI